MTFKEVTTEDLIESIKGSVGRPSASESDRIALDEIMISKEKREALVKEFKRFSIELEQQKSRAKNLNEDIKAVAKETFGLSTKKFKELVSVVDSGDFDGVINTLTSTVDMLEVIKEQGGWYVAKRVPRGFKQASEER